MEWVTQGMEWGLRKLCCAVIRKQVGKYLKTKISVEDLDLSLTSGKFEVRNVELNCERLTSELQIPGWRVASGSVKSLSATVSITQQAEAPLQIQLNGVQIQIQSTHNNQHQNSGRNQNSVPLSQRSNSGSFDEPELTWTEQRIQHAVSAVSGGLDYLLSSIIVQIFDLSVQVDVRNSNNHDNVQSLILRTKCLKYTECKQQQQQQGQNFDVLETSIKRLGIRSVELFLSDKNREFEILNCLGSEEGFDVTILLPDTGGEGSQKCVVNMLSNLVVDLTVDSIFCLANLAESLQSIGGAKSVQKQQLQQKQDFVDSPGYGGFPQMAGDYGNQGVIESLYYEAQEMEVDATASEPASDHPPNDEFEFELVTSPIILKFWHQDNTPNMFPANLPSYLAIQISKSTINGSFNGEGHNLDVKLFSIEGYEYLPNTLNIYNFQDVQNSVSEFVGIPNQVSVQNSTIQRGCFQESQINVFGSEKSSGSVRWPILAIGNKLVQHSHQKTQLQKLSHKQKPQISIEIGSFENQNPKVQIEPITFWITFGMLQRLINTFNLPQQQQQQFQQNSNSFQNSPFQSKNVQNTGFYSQSVVSQRNNSSSKLDVRLNLISVVLLLDEQEQKPNSQFFQNSMDESEDEGNYFEAAESLYSSFSSTASFGAAILSGQNQQEIKSNIGIIQLQLVEAGRKPMEILSIQPQGIENPQYGLKFEIIIKNSNQKQSKLMENAWEYFDKFLNSEINNEQQINNIQIQDSLVTQSKIFISVNSQQIKLKIGKTEIQSLLKLEQLIQQTVPATNFNPSLQLPGPQTAIEINTQIQLLIHGNQRIFSSFLGNFNSFLCFNVGQYLGNSLISAKIEQFTFGFQNNFSRPIISFQREQFENLTVSATEFVDMDRMDVPARDNGKIKPNGFVHLLALNGRIGCTKKNATQKNLAQNSTLVSASSPNIFVDNFEFDWVEDLIQILPNQSQLKNNNNNNNNNNSVNINSFQQQKNTNNSAFYAKVVDCGVLAFPPDSKLAAGVYIGEFGFENSNLKSGHMLHMSQLAVYLMEGERQKNIIPPSDIHTALVTSGECHCLIKEAKLRGKIDLNSKVQIFEFSNRNLEVTISPNRLDQIQKFQKLISPEKIQIQESSSSEPLILDLNNNNNYNNKIVESVIVGFDDDSQNFFAAPAPKNNQNQNQSKQLDFCEFEIPDEDEICDLVVLGSSDSKDFEMCDEYPILEGNSIYNNNNNQKININNKNSNDTNDDLVIEGQWLESKKQHNIIDNYVDNIQSSIPPPDSLNLSSNFQSTPKQRIILSEFKIQIDLVPDLYNSRHLSSKISNGKSSSNSSSSNLNSKPICSNVKIDVTGASLAVDVTSPDAENAFCVKANIQDVKMWSYGLATGSSEVAQKSRCVLSGRSHSINSVGKQDLFLNFKLEAVRPNREIDPTLLEYRLIVALKPLRIKMDQSTLNFLMLFTTNNNNKNKPNNSSFSSKHQQKQQNANVFFQKVDIQEFSVKIDYLPQKFNLSQAQTNRLELINIVKFEATELTLKRVRLSGVPGVESLIQRLVVEWRDDIMQNQWQQLTNAVAFVSSINKLATAGKQLVSVPYQQLRREGAGNLFSDKQTQREISRSVASFALTVVLESLSMGATVAGGAQTILQWGEHQGDPPQTLMEGLRSAGSRLGRCVSSSAQAVVVEPVRSLHQGEGVVTATGKAIQGMATFLTHVPAAAAGAGRDTLLGFKSYLDPNKVPQEL